MTVETAAAALRNNDSGVWDTGRGQHNAHADVAFASASFRKAAECVAWDDLEPTCCLLAPVVRVSGARLSGQLTSGRPVWEPCPSVVLCRPRSPSLPHATANTWMPGCLDAWMPGCLDAWMPGCLDALEDTYKMHSTHVGIPLPPQQNPSTGTQRCWASIATCAPTG